MIDGIPPTTISRPAVSRPATPRASLQGESADSAARAPDTALELTAKEKEQVAKLRAVDQKVRAHEQAHSAAGGAVAGAVQLRFTSGPDGRSYAVAGEVAIDAGAEGDPDATIRKMEQVRRAALAPADPSPQDMRVAAQAEATANAARGQKAKAAASDEERTGSAATPKATAKATTEDAPSPETASASARRALSAYAAAASLGGPPSAPVLAVTA